MPQPSTIPESVQSFVMTVGIKYKHGDHGPQHPLGLHGDGYTIIEAPNYDIAHGIAVAITGREFAFLYSPSVETEDMLRKWHHTGEELRVSWLRPGAMSALASVERELRRPSTVDDALIGGDL